jgi:CBS domain-containing protein
VESGLNVRQVVNYLCDKRCGAVAVTEAGRAVGVFSERDLMSRVILQGLDPDKTVVADVMSKGVISVSPAEDYRVAKAQMLDKRVRHLVVIDENDHLCGTVSMRELVELDLKEYEELVNKLNDRYYRSALKEG